jgi:DNA modification methylase
MHQLINADCLDVLPSLEPAAAVFIDPPDGVGLKYAGVSDKYDDYMGWLARVIEMCIAKAPTVWVSYNAIHDLAVKHWAYEYQLEHGVKIRPFIQPFSFGQNRNSDCGNGHRPLLRIRQPDAPLYPEQIKVPSWRELNGDKRAAKGGRVPLDVWDFPRVTGNSKQRRPYHPTQLHEGLVERALLLTTKEGDHVIDCCAGTATTLRVCKRIGRRCTLIEKSPYYCEEIAKEHKMVHRHTREMILWESA